MNQLVLAGILLPDSFLHGNFFLVLSALVALNTTIYAALAIAKIVPKVLRPRLWRRGRQRAETRSIYPDGPL
ncbi:MAG TPA: hypothetical protein VK139_08170 [Microbacteriaceae bacterium]|nr:hypothetical protein [Microbacteriaceae bacterium]